MEKARQQKTQVAPKNPDHLAPDVEADIAAIDARRNAAPTKTADAPDA